MTKYLPVPGFPGYDIGTDGNVRSYWHRRAFGRGYGTKFVLGDVPRVLRPELNHGYSRVCLYRDGQVSRRRVHVLVLTTFRGPCPAGMQACHKNGKRADNRLGNLRWGTPSSNQRDRRKHGTLTFHLAKLDAARVIRIVAEFRSGASRTALARKHQVDTATINRVLCGRTWSHVTGIRYRPTRAPYKKRQTTDGTN